MDSPPSLVPRRAITWRSATLGLLATLIICGVTPYNDYVLGNTPFVGFNLPVGLVVMVFLFALLVNGPLSRFRPRLALSGGELAVAFAMALVSCSLPSSALMRYLPPSLVAPFRQAQSRVEVMAVMEGLDLPTWTLPAYAGDGPRDWANDPVARDYAMRWAEPNRDVIRAWVRPIAAWGVYVAALYGATMLMIVLVRRQWYENERLPFPLAQIEVGLIEPPAPGRWFNATLGRRSFWLAFGSVFAVHALNGLYNYHPTYFPELPVTFKLQEVFSERPWTYAADELKSASLFFSMAGVAYFLPNAVSFSLWFFFVLQQVMRMVVGSAGGDTNMPGLEDQQFGGVMAYALIVLWIGRKHWALILRQAFRGERPGEPRGRYLSYPAAFWGLVACVVVLTAWLALAGATVGGAVVVTGGLLLLMFIVARVVAETGLVHNGIGLRVSKPFELAAMAGVDRPVPVRTFYVASSVSMLHHDPREIFSVFGTHAVKVTDDAAFDHGHADDRRLGRRLLGLFAAVIVVGYVTSFASMLWCEYSFAVTKQVVSKPVSEYANGWGAQASIVDPLVEYDRGIYPTSHNPLAHASGGAAATVGLSLLRLRFPWWPLHPIGYLAMNSWPLGQAWFSIFCGWAVRSLVLRFGGSRLFVDGKPPAIGVIVGESFAAGFWMILGMAFGTLGMEYRTMRILPD